MSHNLNKKIQKIILISSFIVILISHSFNSIVVNAQTTLIKKPLKLGLDLWVPDLLTYIAQEKGYFEKNNVDVNLTLIQNYGDILNGYANGDFDGIFTVYSDIITQQSNGIDTKIVYNPDSSYTADAIVGKGNNLLDIQGKRIGVEGINTFSHFFVLKSGKSWSY